MQTEQEITFPSTSGFRMKETGILINKSANPENL